MYQFGIGTEALSQADNLSNSGAVPGWNGSVSGTANWDMVTQNPCPTGWRVPTITEWAGVLDNNTISRTNDGGTSWNTSTVLTWTTGDEDNGIKFGDALVLPAAGLRTSGNGTLSNRGYYGYYWSSAAALANTGRRMYFVNSTQNTNSNYDRSYGYSVRCVEE
jgi:uncharacterized protein (TIGR02145 family)